MTPKKGYRVYVEELKEAIPGSGYYVKQTQEVKRYIKDGLLETPKAKGKRARK